MLKENLTIDPATGLLPDTTYLASPNQDERPANTDIDMIVIHGISLPPGQFGGNTIERFFCNHLDTSEHPALADISHLKVSSHLLIKRTGEIIQFVPFGKRAWHAGESFFEGKARCNDFSIGIELEGTDDIAYEPVQYRQLSRAILAIMQAYPKVSMGRIVGHADIAPGRKTDPGAAFDWSYLKGMLI